MFTYNARLPVYRDHKCQCMTIIDRKDFGEGCFDPFVLIQMADKSWKKAESLFQGDELYNPVLKKSVKIASLVIGAEKKPMIEVGFGQRTIIVTDTHPLMTAAGLKRVMDLTMDDVLIGADGEQHQVTTLQTLAVKPGQMVINMMLQLPPGAGLDEHMINANGIVSGDFALQNKLSQKSK